VPSASVPQRSWRSGPMANSDGGECPAGGKGKKKRAASPSVQPGVTVPPAARPSAAPPAPARTAGMAQRIGKAVRRDAVHSQVRRHPSRWLTLHTPSMLSHWSLSATNPPGSSSISDGCCCHLTNDLQTG